MWPFTKKKKPEPILRTPTRPAYPVNRKYSVGSSGTNRFDGIDPYLINEVINEVIDAGVDIAHDIHYASQPEQVHSFYVEESAPVSSPSSYTPTPTPSYDPPSYSEPTYSAPSYTPSSYCSGSSSSYDSSSSSDSGCCDCGGGGGGGGGGD